MNPIQKARLILAQQQEAKRVAEFWREYVETEVSNPNTVEIILEGFQRRLERALARTGQAQIKDPEVARGTVEALIRWHTIPTGTEV